MQVLQREAAGQVQLRDLRGNRPPDRTGWLVDAGGEGRLQVSRLRELRTLRRPAPEGIREARALTLRRAVLPVQAMPPHRPRVDRAPGSFAQPEARRRCVFADCQQVPDAMRRPGRPPEDRLDVLPDPRIHLSALPGVYRKYGPVDDRRAGASAPKGWSSSPTRRATC